jgi:hypothetical protein
MNINYFKIPQHRMGLLTSFIIYETYFVVGEFL